MFNNTTSTKTAKTTLQRNLDADAAAQNATTAVAENGLEFPTESDTPRPLFVGKPGGAPQQTFRVDLLGAWMKA